MPLATASGGKLPRQGGLKLFFDLIFCYFFIKEKVIGPGGYEPTNVNLVLTNHQGVTCALQGYII
jgi:hypothetical protein